MSAATGLILIGIWTAIQSIGFGAMAFMGLLAHNCQMNMNGTRMSHFLYAVYFRDHQCQPVDWSFLLDQTVDVEPIMPNITHVASRTNILAILYFVVSVIWLVTSLMLLVGTCISCMGKCGYILMFHPWIYVTVISLLLDLVASGYFIWDLINSVSWNLFLHHLEVSNASSLPFFSNEYLLPLPAIILLCISGRLLIIWISNIVLIFFVNSLGKKVVFGSDKTERSNILLNDRPSLEPAGANPNNNNQIGYIVGAGVVDSNGPLYESFHHSTRRMDTNRYSDPVVHQHNDVQEYNRPSKLVYPTRRRLEPRESTIRSENSGHYSDGKINDNTDNAKMSKIKSHNILQNKHSEKLSASQKNPYLGKYEEERLSIDRPHLISPKVANTYDESAKTRMESRHISNNPPAELRGQLPWSYFKSRDDVSGPRKTFTQLKDGEVAPPVPVPDYTLHFPRKDRPRTSSVTTFNGKWDGPEAQF